MQKKERLRIRLLTYLILLSVIILPISSATEEAIFPSLPPVNDYSGNVFGKVIPIGTSLSTSTKTNLYGSFVLNAIPKTAPVVSNDQSIPPPTPIVGNIKIYARADCYSATLCPYLTLKVNNETVNTWNVNNKNSYQYYQINYNHSITSLALIFPNDEYLLFKGDNNLYVDHLMVNDQKINVNESTFIYDRGQPNKPETYFDNIDVISGRRELSSSGALILNTLPSPSPIIQTCIDSDGENNVYVKGTCTSPSNELTDACVGGLLLEARCSFDTCVNGPVPLPCPDGYRCHDGSCVITPVNPITVISPNGGEQLVKGQTYTVTWNNSNNFDKNVKVYLYKGGQYYRALTTGIKNTGSFSWAVSKDLPVGSDYKITVMSSVNKTIRDYSDTIFSIIASGGKVVNILNSHAVNNCNNVVTVSCTTDNYTNSVFPYYNFPNSGVLQGQFVTIQNGNNYITYWNVSSNASGTYQVGCYLDNTLSYTDLNKNVHAYPYSQPFLKNISINPCVQQNATCTDSDGGNNVYVKGAIIVNGVVKNADYCIQTTDDFTLNEFYCLPQPRYAGPGYTGGTYALNITQCPSGYSCDDGACVAQTNQPSHNTNQPQSVISTAITVFSPQNNEIISNLSNSIFKWRIPQSPTVYYFFIVRKLDFNNQTEEISHDQIYFGQRGLNWFDNQIEFNYDQLYFGERGLNQLMHIKSDTDGSEYPPPPGAYYNWSNYPPPGVYSINLRTFVSFLQIHNAHADFLPGKYEIDIIANSPQGSLSAPVVVFEYRPTPVLLAQTELVGYYSFSGERPSDESGKNNSGSFAGAIDCDYFYGVKGKGCSYGNSRSYFDVSSVKGDINPLQGAISLWVFPLKEKTNTFVLEGNAGNNNYIIQFDGASFNFVRGNNKNNVISFNGVQLKKWYHLVLTWELENDEQIMKAYINGNLVGTKSFSGQEPFLDSSVLLVGGSREGNEFLGYIDELRFYSGALTSKKVMDIYNEKGVFPFKTFFRDDVVWLGSNINITHYGPGVNFDESKVNYLIHRLSEGADVYAVWMLGWVPLFKSTLACRNYSRPFEESANLDPSCVAKVQADPFYTLKQHEAWWHSITGSTGTSPTYANYILEQNKDMVQFYIDNIRKNGMSPSISFAVNDEHQLYFVNQDPRTWPRYAGASVSKFFYDNPQYRHNPPHSSNFLGGQVWASPAGVNQPVIDYKLHQIWDLTRFYDFDLLELDFMRSSYLWDGSVPMRTKNEVTSSFIRQSRKFLDENTVPGKKRYLGIRINVYNEINDYIGIPLEDLDKLGVDYVILASGSFETQDSDVEKIRAKIPENIPIFFETAQVSSAIGKVDNTFILKKSNAEQIYTTAAIDYAKGASGAYALNWEYYWAYGQNQNEAGPWSDPPFVALDNIKDKGFVSDFSNKYYFIGSYPRQNDFVSRSTPLSTFAYYDVNMSTFSYPAIPRYSVQNRDFKITVTKPQSSNSGFIIRIFSENSLADTNWETKLNGATLEETTDVSSPYYSESNPDPYNPPIVFGGPQELNVTNCYKNSHCYKSWIVPKELLNINKEFDYINFSLVRLSGNDNSKKIIRHIDLYAPHWASTQNVSTESHKIGVRGGSSGSVQLASASNNEAEFYDTVTGQEFIPRGNVYFLTMPQGFKAEQPRYAGWAYDSLDIYEDVFSPQVYNHNKISNDLDTMKSLGYNIVKIYLPYYDHPDVSLGQRLNSVVLDNMVDFLRMARDKGMYVYFNSGQIPLSYNDIVDSYPAPANIDGFNGFFMSKGMIEAEKKYHLDLLDGIKERDPSVINTIFGYDLAVEGFYTSYENGKPWILTSGTVTPANGKTYDLSSPVERKALADESTAYWVQQVAGAVKEKYPHLLLTESIFTPYLSQPDICTGYDGLVRGCGKEPLNVKVIASSPYIDFLTLQIYPNLNSYSGGSYDIKKDLATAGIIEGQKFSDGSLIGKPLFVGEFGSHSSFYPTLNSAENAIVQQQVNSCDYGFKGWIYFPWYGLTPSDSTSHQDIGVWTATEQNNAIANLMSPKERPDACSYGTFVQKIVSFIKRLFSK